MQPNLCGRKKMRASVGVAGTISFDLETTFAFVRAHNARNLLKSLASIARPPGGVRLRGVPGCAPTGVGSLMKRGLGRFSWRDSWYSAEGWRILQKTGLTRAYRRYTYRRISRSAWVMTKSSEHALRALVFLAQREDQWPIPGREIAKGADIPAKYLQKILGDLTRTGVLESSPGRSGGFRLCRPSNRIPLLDVLKPFERSQADRCPFGNTVCSDRNPCRAHYGWKKVVEAERRFLQELTLGDVAKPAEAARRGRKR